MRGVLRHTTRGDEEHSRGRAPQMSMRPGANISSRRPQNPEDRRRSAVRSCLCRRHAFFAIPSGGRLRGSVAPDLTHLASRRGLAANTLTN